jgi:hypothetical protein
VPEAGAHNLWAEGDLLYVGHYQGGLGAQIFKGNIFSSDLHSGLWVTKYQREPLTP